MDPIFFDPSAGCRNDDAIFGESVRVGDWELKVWGRTRIELAGPQYVRTHLSAFPGGYSSVHYHRERANRFHVLRGCLDVWILHGWDVERVRLTDGNQLAVPSLVVHGFYAVARTWAVEEYWPDRGGVCAADDIVRLTTGGRISGSPTAGDELIRKIVWKAVSHE
jgi:mannose-6-phosphate isomerase-like protein (cupin superfamily)